MGGPYFDGESALRAVSEYDARSLKDPQHPEIAEGFLLV